ncbi:MAG: glycoside hydrolase family 99-like domain-containing protein [Betaproteobacteria bacterium]
MYRNTSIDQDDLVKLVALYFPQLHAIPENDAWWGKGFTDWTNVRKARPQFDGHFQPRVPLDGRYYDQSQMDTLKWQIDLARKYGVHGFCHYHYWFDGKQLLETPTNLMLENKELDFPFCLAWANETWSRRWDGEAHHILQEQTHRPDRKIWAQHFEYLYRAWSDERAIKIDGKPVFLIYRPHLVNELGGMFALWREMALQRGLKGLYLIAMKQQEYPKPEMLDHFDASMHFQPFAALNSPNYEENIAARRAGLRRSILKLLPERFKVALRAIRYRFFPSLVFYDYEKTWNQILKIDRDRDMPTFPGAFVDWDNTARYGNRARIFRGASPERFAYWFRQLVAVTAQRPKPERTIFLNAWNEWAEGTYLEPDTRHGYRYLEAVKDGLAAQENEKS